MNKDLRELGEEGLIGLIKRFMPIGQTSDDTAEINLGGKNLIINTDVLIEDVHFSDKFSSPQEIGWKAVASNLSDLACSGVLKNIGITIGLIAPPSTCSSWVEGVYKGMEDALKVYGGNILGGDISRGSQKVLSITAVGERGPLRLHRNEARPNDWLITTGPHGLSGLGLALLLNDEIAIGTKLPESLKTKAVLSHKKPIPQSKIIHKVINCKPKNTPWRAAGTDSSDGLIEAIKGICISSQCQAVLNKNELPTAEGWPRGKYWEDLCLFGGEDFELILSLPEEWATNLLKEIPESFLIGIIRDGKEQLSWNNGELIDLYSKKLFKHF